MELYMLRVIKNPLRQHIKTHFRNRDIVFKSKNSKVFDTEKEEDLAEYRHWLNTYQFLFDNTVNNPKLNEGKVI